MDEGNRNVSGNMDGKICMVTGGSSGIGKETALGLARLGATVVVVARNPERGAATIDEIKRRSGNDAVECMLADLSSQQSIRDLARAYMDAHDRLHVLVNNAGAVYTRRQTTTDGIEMTLAVDHLAYFLLTDLLLPVLKVSAPARIVNVSSDAQRGGKINFDDLQGQKRYRAFGAYSQAKLANVLFTYELARRLTGSGVTANALHPGLVASGFARNNRGIVSLLMPLAHVFMIGPEKGAETSIYLASSPDLEGVSGQYFVNKTPRRSSTASYDQTMAARLWEVSARMTGVAGVAA